MSETTIYVLVRDIKLNELLGGHLLYSEVIGAYHDVFEAECEMQRCDDDRGYKDDLSYVGKYCLYHVEEVTLHG